MKDAWFYAAMAAIIAAAIFAALFVWAAVDYVQLLDYVHAHGRALCQ